MLNLHFQCRILGVLEFLKEFRQLALGFGQRTSLFQQALLVLLLYNPLQQEDVSLKLLHRAVIDSKKYGEMLSPFRIPDIAERPLDMMQLALVEMLVMPLNLLEILPCRVIRKGIRLESFDQV
jgi:hypothetical protein